MYKAVNPAFEIMFGISSEDIPGKLVSDFMGTEDARALYHAFQASLARGAEVRERHRLVTARSRTDIETVVTPIREPEPAV
jgi:PAS domain S-box-containing protein